VGWAVRDDEFGFLRWCDSGVDVEIWRKGSIEQLLVQGVGNEREVNSVSYSHVF
jgi:hypothetical protein